MTESWWRFRARLEGTITRNSPMFDDDTLGTITAGRLPPQKARVLLMPALACGTRSATCKVCTTAPEARESAGCARRRFAASRAGAMRAWPGWTVLALAVAGAMAAQPAQAVLVTGAPPARAIPSFIRDSPRRWPTWNGPAIPCCGNWSRRSGRRAGSSSCGH